MYTCTFMCFRCYPARTLRGIALERHPVTFPQPRPTCLDCGAPTSLASFTVQEHPSPVPPRKVVVRRPTKPGQLSLFPDFSG